MKIEILNFHMDKDKNSFPYLNESPYFLLESNRFYGMSTLQYACLSWGLDMCTNQSRFHLRIHGQFYLLQKLLLFYLYFYFVCRKNEIKSLEEKCAKENQARITDIAKLDGKLDSENSARKTEIANLDKWAKGENDSRKTEIANLDNFAHSENDARKAEIAALDNFAKTENDGRKSDIASLNQRLEAEQTARDGEDKAINERISKEITDREQANNELQVDFSLVFEISRRMFLSDENLFSPVKFFFCIDIYIYTTLSF